MVVGGGPADCRTWTLSDFDFRSGLPRADFAVRFAAVRAQLHARESAAESWSDGHVFTHRETSGQVAGRTPWMYHESLLLTPNAQPLGQDALGSARLRELLLCVIVFDFTWFPMVVRQIFRFVFMWHVFV